MSDDRPVTEQAIASLLLSPEFNTITAAVKEKNWYKILKIDRKELVHSNLLAYLFDESENHGCGSSILKSFLEQIYLREQASSGAGFTLGELLQLDFKGVQILREHLFIDLILLFPKSQSVIAIENKIDASERQDQIKDYQKKLELNYSGYHLKKIIYLTPRGIESSTHDEGSEVDCLSVPYECLLEALNDNMALVSPTIKPFIETSIQHIKEDIMGDSEIKSLVEMLWSNSEYVKALDKIYKFRPVLGDQADKYRNAIQALVKSSVDSDIQFKPHPTTGKPNELKFKIKRWSDSGLPFTFMYYHFNSSPAPGLRLFISKDDFSCYEATLLAWSEFCKSQNHNAKLDENFTPVKHWSYWRRVFTEVDYPDESYLDDHSFNDQMLDKVLARVDSIIGQLTPLVDAFIEHSNK